VSAMGLSSLVKHVPNRGWAVRRREFPHNFKRQFVRVAVGRPTRLLLLYSSSFAKSGNSWQIFFSIEGTGETPIPPVGGMGRLGNN